MRQTYLHWVLVEFTVRFFRGSTAALPYANDNIQSVTLCAKEGE
jgi:hypothetical protein